MRDEAERGEASRVFLLRVWLDGEWRGRLQDLLSGEARSFAGWDELLAVLAAALTQPEDTDELAQCRQGEK